MYSYQYYVVVRRAGQPDNIVGEKEYSLDPSDQQVAVNNGAFQQALQTGFANQNKGGALTAIIGEAVRNEAGMYAESPILFSCSGMQQGGVDAVLAAFVHIGEVAPMFVPPTRKHKK